MKILLPGGLMKDIKPTSCNPVDENGQIKICLVLDPLLTLTEAKLVKEGAEAEIVAEQAVDSDIIAEKQMFVDGLDPLVP